MAAKNFAPVIFRFNSYEEYETIIKKRLKWNNKEWTAAGESGSRMSKLCHSLNFWKHKLKPALDESSFIFTLFNVERDVKFDILKIITEIENLDSSVKVKGISEFRNPRYLCIHFKDREDKNNIEAKFKMIEDSFVTYVSWALSPDVNVTTIKIHWLPLTLDINIIKKELDKYVDCVEEIRTNLTFMSGRIMPTGRITFKANLKKDIKVEEIPHVTSIANMETLITISGRQPLCLNCNSLGHISKECVLRYCSVCKRMENKIHDCGVNTSKCSFAEIAKTGRKIQEITPDDWGNEIIIQDKQEINEDKRMISHKIAGLEKKIQDIEQEDQEREKERLEKKRKIKIWFKSDTKDLIHSTSEQVNSGMTAFNWEISSEEEEADDSMQVKTSVATKVNDQVPGFRMVNQKKKNKARKKNVESNKTQRQDESQVEKKNNVLKNYGRPVSGIERKWKQDKTFDKKAEIREFVFKD